MEYKDLLTLAPGRILIDVASEGCGSCCSYCYVPSKGKFQKLASFEEINSLCDYVCNTTCKDTFTIISFCPNTEPFKTQDSIDRIIFILQRLVILECCFQISTKEVIPDSVIKKLHSISLIRPIFINISMPTLDCTQEPFAANPRLRLSNFYRLRNFPSIKMGLYIKPVINDTIKCCNEYIQIIHEYMPDYVCTGLLFNIEGNNYCVSTYNDDVALQLVDNQYGMLSDFANIIIENTKCMHSFSSICIIYRLLRKKCQLKLWKYDVDICDNCPCI